jgi:hypothetical protein
MKSVKIINGEANSRKWRPEKPKADREVGGITCNTLKL